MKKLRVGVVGLGGIAQRPGCLFWGRDGLDAARGVVTYPREGRADLQKRRMPYAASLQDLVRDCDAVFVHTSTATHYQVVSELLNAGVHVCVDKPGGKHSGCRTAD